MSIMALDLASMEPAVLEAIDAIRPALQSDGGDIVFREIDADGVVHVQLVGACGSCPVSTMTSSGSSWIAFPVSPRSSPTSNRSRRLRA